MSKGDKISPSYGEWTEEHVRATARRQGQPDFLFAPVVAEKGSGTREIGDALLWLGHQLVIVSVKSRNIERLGQDSEERARAWLTGAIAEAGRQIDGVARTLRESQGITLQSERGVQVPWEWERVTEIYGALVVNYTPPPEFVPALNTSMPSFCLLATEWDFLLETVYSTSGVVGYVAERTSRAMAAPLGCERDVFAVLADAERTGLPPEFPEGRPPAGSWDRLSEQHPEVLFGAHRDDRFAFIIDAMIAGAADWDPEWSSSLDAHSYLAVAEALERIPRLTRIPLGKRVMEKSHLAHEEGRPRYFVAHLPGGQLFFLAHPGDRKARQSSLQQFVVAVHTRRLGEGAPSGFFTLGVATEPYPNEGRSHDFFHISGGFRLSTEERSRREEFLREHFRRPRAVNEEVLRQLR